MRVSFVLRVDADRLASGQLIGEIEEVATGRIGPLTGPADIQSFCFYGLPETDGTTSPMGHSRPWAGPVASGEGVIQ